MAKKLPGLTRQAPDVQGVAQSVPSKPEKEKKARKPRTRKATPKTENVKPLTGEILSPETQENIMIERLAKARIIVERRASWAIAGGAVPIPIIDIIAISALQLAMLNELSLHYNVPFEKNRGKAILSALVGGVLPYFAGVGIGSTLMKVIPVIGWVAGVATTAVLGGATTRAVGNVFIQHFEAGGTFLDFDPVATRAYFKKEFLQAKKG